MHPRITIPCILVLALLAGIFTPAVSARAYGPQTAPLALEGDVTAFDLIIAMNTLRASYGHPALIEDPIIDAVAQNTAEIMAANEMSWHIGNVSGRLQSAGFGGGAKVWGTENFAVASHMSIDEIMLVWSDDSHMIPAVNAAYCNIGAGVAKAANGMTYYVLQAAYTSGKSCGEYTSSGSTTTQSGTTNTGRVPGVSQLIVPVKVATPDADGKIYHVVEAGQSFWSIAVAYKITIKDLEVWNNISRNSKLQLGQKLFIPSKETVGFATPTPVWMVQTSTPDANGKIIHEVKAYQTLSGIAAAYNVKIDTILALNHIQADWPLQIGQKLLIYPGNITPSATPRPLKPVEKLTPASDGKYYHVVRSGETLSWIASLYEIQLNDLMAWNNMNSSSVLQVDQKLLLQVTPPATATPISTATFTPGPVTDTPTVTPTLSPTPSQVAVTTQTPAIVEAVSAQSTAAASGAGGLTSDAIIWIALGSLALGGLLLIVISVWKK